MHSCLRHNATQDGRRLSASASSGCAGQFVWGWGVIGFEQPAYPDFDSDGKGLGWMIPSQTIRSVKDAVGAANDRPRRPGPSRVPAEVHGVGLNPDKRQRCGQRAERAWMLCRALLRRTAWGAANPAGYAHQAAGVSARVV